MGLGSALLCISLATFVIDAPSTDSSYSGKVTTISATQVTMLDAQGENRSFEVSSDAKITLNGKPAKLTDIEVGDQIKVTTRVKDGKPLAIVIEAKDTE